nr:TPA: hypothetical protein BN1204_043560 [Neospora caninum Liverpool]
MDGSGDEAAGSPACAVRAGTVLKNAPLAVRSDSVSDRRMERRRPTALKAPTEKRPAVQGGDRGKGEEPYSQTHPFFPGSVYREGTCQSFGACFGGQEKAENGDQTFEDSDARVEDGTEGESRDGRETPDAAALLLELVAKEQELLSLQQENEQLREDLADAASDGEADLGQLRAQFALRLKEQQEAADAAATQLVREVEAARTAALEAERGREALQAEMLRAEQALSRLIQQVDASEKTEARLMKEVKDLRMHQCEMEAALGFQLETARKEAAALREEKEAAEQRYRRSMEAESHMASALCQVQEQKRTVEVELRLHEVRQFEAEKFRSEQVERKEQLQARETDAGWQAERQRLMRDRAEEEKRLRGLLKAADEALARCRQREEEHEQALQASAEKEALLNQEVTRLRGRQGAREKELGRQLEAARQEVASLESETQLLKQTLTEREALEKNFASTVERLRQEVATKVAALDSQKATFEAEQARLRDQQAEAATQLAKWMEAAESTRRELAAVKLEHASKQRNLQEQLQAAEAAACQLRGQVVHAQREADEIAEISKRLRHEIASVNLQKAEAESAARERVSALETQVASLQRQRGEAEQEMQRRTQIEDLVLKDVEEIVRARVASDEQFRQQIAALEAERSQLQREIQKAERSVRKHKLAETALNGELADLQKRTAVQEERWQQRIVSQEKELERLRQLTDPQCLTKHTHFRSDSGGADAPDVPCRQEEAQQAVPVEPLLRNSYEAFTAPVEAATRRQHLEPPEREAGSVQTQQSSSADRRQQGADLHCPDSLRARDSVADGSHSVCLRHTRAPETPRTPGDGNGCSGEAVAAERQTQRPDAAGEETVAEWRRERADEDRSAEEGGPSSGPVPHLCRSRSTSPARTVPTDHEAWRRPWGKRAVSRSYSETIYAEAGASPLSSSRKASASFHRASCEFLQQEVTRLSKAYTRARAALEEAQEKRRGDGQRLESLLLQLEDGGRGVLCASTGGNAAGRVQTAAGGETGSPNPEQEPITAEELHSADGAQDVEDQEALQDLMGVLANEIGYAGLSGGVLRAAVSTLKTLLQRKAEGTVGAPGSGGSETSQRPDANSTFGLFYRHIRRPPEKGEPTESPEDDALREWPPSKPVELRQASGTGRGAFEDKSPETQGRSFVSLRDGTSRAPSAAMQPAEGRTTPKTVQDKFPYEGSDAGGSEVSSNDYCGYASTKSVASSCESSEGLQDSISCPDLRLEEVRGESRNDERTGERSLSVAGLPPTPDARSALSGADQEGTFRLSGTFEHTGCLHEATTDDPTTLTAEAAPSQRSDPLESPGGALVQKQVNQASGGAGPNNEEARQPVSCTTQFFSIADECVDSVALQQLLHEREDEVAALEDALEQSQRREAALVGRLAEAERLLETLHQCTVAAEHRGGWPASEALAALLSGPLHEGSNAADRRAPTVLLDNLNGTEETDGVGLDCSDSKTHARDVRFKALETDNEAVTPQPGATDTSCVETLACRVRFVASQERGGDANDCKSVDDVCQRKDKSTVAYSEETHERTAADGTEKSASCIFCGLKATKEADLSWLPLVRQAWMKLAATHPEAWRRQHPFSVVSSLAACEDQMPTDGPRGRALPFLPGTAERPATGHFFEDDSRLVLVIPALPRHLTLCAVSAEHTAGSNWRPGVSGPLSAELQFVPASQMDLECQSVRPIPADSSEALAVSNSQADHAEPSGVHGTRLCTSSTAETLLRLEVCMSDRKYGGDQPSAFLSVAVMLPSEDPHEDEIAAINNTGVWEEKKEAIPLRVSFGDSGDSDDTLFRLHRKHPSEGVVEPSGDAWESLRPNLEDAKNLVYLQHVGTQLFLVVPGIQLIDCASEASLAVLVRRARSANAFCASNLTSLNPSGQPKRERGDDQPMNLTSCCFVGTKRLADATPFLLVSPAEVAEREAVLDAATLVGSPGLTSPACLPFASLSTHLREIAPKGLFDYKRCRSSDGAPRPDSGKDSGLGTGDFEREKDDWVHVGDVPGGERRYRGHSGCQGEEMWSLWCGAVL